MSDDIKWLVEETLKDARKKEAKRFSRQKNSLDPMYRRKLNLDKQHSFFGNKPVTNIQKADRILQEHSRRTSYTPWGEEPPLKKRYERAKRLAEIKKASGGSYDPKYWTTEWDEVMERGRIPEMRGKRPMVKLPLEPLEDTIEDQILGPAGKKAGKLILKGGGQAAKIAIAGGKILNPALMVIDALTNAEVAEGDDDPERREIEAPWSEEGKALRKEMLKRKLMRLKK